MADEGFKRKLTAIMSAILGEHSKWLIKRF